MTFPTPLDELHHWLGMLTVDIMRGVERRHNNVTARLCQVLLERVQAGVIKGNLEQELQLSLVSFQLLDLQRALRGDPPRQKGSVRGPVLRLVGG